jgi:hypothetical protein
MQASQLPLKPVLLSLCPVDRLQALAVDVALPRSFRGLLLDLIAQVTI